MKYCDIKTGKIFESIEEATDNFCAGKSCYDCPMPNLCREGSLPEDCANCSDFVKNHPSEAAKIMGIKIFVKKEFQICKLLEVEINQLFNINYPEKTFNCLTVKPDGKVWEIGQNPQKISDNVLYYLIEHKDEIIRKIFLTDEEIEKVTSIRKVDLT